MFRSQTGGPGPWSPADSAVSSPSGHPCMDGGDDTSCQELHCNAKTRIRSVGFVEFGTVSAVTITLHCIASVNLHYKRRHSNSPFAPTNARPHQPTLALGRSSFRAEAAGSVTSRLTSAEAATIVANRKHLTQPQRRASTM